MSGLICRLLLRLVGTLITTYLMPLFNPEVRAALEDVLPIAERYVRSYILAELPGTKKRELTSALIWQELERLGKDDGIVQADIDQAIQLAYYRLGLDKAKRGEA